MPLLVKDGLLASIGGALKAFVAGCADACCAKWYCHLPDYTCDQTEEDHISQHSSESACLKACGEGVEHYCHTDGECDTDPTNSTGTYPSKKDCDDACGQWWCCYESTDYTKGSSCQEGPCDQPDLIRAGPFESKEECEPDCALQYYCVLADGTDGSQPDHYMCVVDPAGMLVISGPQTEEECNATCSTRRPSIWCVDEKKCVLSYSGPPVECSFGAFCEEYDDFIECGQECLKEQWYCVPADKQCMQLAMPPTPDAPPYSSQAACEEECQAYYCCWVSQGDPTKGSYCQLGKCDDGFEKSGPHDDEGICEADCNSIYCWSYYDTAISQMVKVCQEDSPDECTPLYSCDSQLYTNTMEEGLQKKSELEDLGFEVDDPVQGIGEFPELFTVKYRCPLELCDGLSCTGDPIPPDCTHEDIQKVSGPYGRETDCNRVCFPPEYRWFCKDEVCTECCASGTCKPTDITCPDGGTYNTEEDCKLSCGSPCYFCEDGTLTEDHLPPDVCLEFGGSLTKPEDCSPPPQCQPAPDCQDAFNSKAQCDGKQEAWVNCSNNDCTANDFQEAKCLDGLPEALESQGWNVVVRNEQCCECGPTGSADGTQLMNVFACCDGTADGLVANFIYIPRNEDDPCQWCSGLSGVEATFKDGKPVWSIQRCNPPPPPPNCPPGKFCSWTPPDPCSTGKCFSFESDDPIECPEGFPYDCTSEEACNQWYAAHPNPPCDCWFCEDGTWVNKPSLNCINEGGILGQKPPAEDCLPPPEYTTPGWYVHCVAAELTDGNGNGTGVVQNSGQRYYFYSSMPRFPMDLGDGDYAMKILAGPFGTIQGADAWIVANGGVDKDCVDAGSPIRPPAARLPENPLP